MFKPLIYETYSEEIWSNLEKEVLKGSEIKESCLKAITAIVRNMSQSDNKEILSKICQNVYDISCGNLRPDADLFSNTCDLLLAMAKGSKQTCRLVYLIFLN